ncbi:hypothetical protein LTR25_008305 [Vermiconidia calcicola]|uniref:Uncharacterized protein n=1 Tax=Vermiconidia calcicola TaxID=1690605 RepID=A0AAV9Q1G4_9PEZI|nr:hypothetical protein LTR25_008305 [Vermiconidia calcicola]
MTPVANCCGTMGSQKYFISERINVKLMMLTWNFAQDKEEFTPFVTQNLFGELRPRSPPKRIAQQIVERNALALDDLDTIIFSSSSTTLTRRAMRTGIIVGRSGKTFPELRPSWVPGHLSTVSLGI